MDDPDWSTLFHVLADERRRELLVGLVKAGRLSVQAGPLGGADGRLRTRDVHVHLPKLDEAGYAEWDSEAGELRPGPKFETVQQVLWTLALPSAERVEEVG